MLVLNLIEADAATITGRKKNAPSPIALRMISVEESSSSKPVILRTIASSFTIEPPMIAGISGDIVPTNASRILAPITFGVSLTFFSGSLDSDEERLHNAITSLYA